MQFGVCRIIFPGGDLVLSAHPSPATPAPNRNLAKVKFAEASAAQLSSIFVWGYYARLKSSNNTMVPNIE